MTLDQLLGIYNEEVNVEPREREAIMARVTERVTQWYETAEGLEEIRNSTMRGMAPLAVAELVVQSLRGMTKPIV